MPPNPNVRKSDHMSDYIFNNDQQTITLTQTVVVNGAFPNGNNTTAFPMYMVRTFAFNFAPSPDTLIAQGQLLSIAANPTLFVLAGLTYGGDYITTFAIPNLAGNITVGAGPTANLGAISGENQTTISQVQSSPVSGGTSQPVSNEQPSLSLNYLIRATNAPNTNGLIGEVDAFAGSGEPGQFLVANGQTVLIADYPQLFAVIGTTYGGNGTTTFAVPNLVGRNIIGASSVSPLGTMVGQQTVSLTNANATVPDGGQNVAFDNRAPGLALNYIICLQGIYPIQGSYGDAIIGEVRAYAGSASQIPQGWALANGKLLSIRDNIYLFSLLGTIYGGDGITTFALPNLSDTVIAGSGGDQPFGKIYGENSTTLQPNDAACFCVGSLIRTSNGNVAVEDIQIGDQIMVYNCEDTTRQVIWVGYSQCTVDPHLADDEAGYPIRILKNAIARGIPYKNMLITAEHCLFFDGRFVPARMLVNGRSIFYDKDIKSYDYYHIETEQHSVIMADGVLTESYLDTGNRRAFKQLGTTVSITHARQLTWDNAAAPLDVSRSFVEPIFSMINANADQVEHRLETKPLLRTSRPDLHLITSAGSIIYPVREKGDRVIFMIPANVMSVRICSNASRPSDIIGPFVDDRRYFGVQIGEILLFESSYMRKIEAHFSETDLDGWHNLAGQEARWTSGNALLPLGKRVPNSTTLMAIQIKAAGPYAMSTATEEIAANFG